MSAERRSVRLLGYADLAEWRDAARGLLADGVAPENIDWIVADAATLFDEPAPSERESNVAGSRLRVPREFLALAARVLAHRDPQRHALAYRLLWRIAHGEANLFERITDADVHRANDWARGVRRDMHKMKAFVRFREIAAGEAAGEFVAWFEPEHYIVDLVAPFFVRRFAGMRWSILTPYRSLSWNGSMLQAGAGAQRSDAPADDALESTWRTYYANIFNPARLKLGAMQSEMPVRYWKNLPEAELIPQLVIDAGRRWSAMVDAAPTTPRKRVPTAVSAEPAATPSASSVAGLRREARECRACPLWKPATQTVFGEGPDDARIMVIGEQPGDQEDLAGKPFVGPAGKLFDRVLEEAGLDRDDLYVTNTVKHFKFEPRGKRRLHKSANAAEQAACRMWLDAELARIHPQRILCLGAMAAQAIFGRGFRLMQQRGEWIELDDGRRAMATVHPSYLLRLRGDEERDEAYSQFVRDLKKLRD